jgi:hypothetical protein
LVIECSVIHQRPLKASVYFFSFIFHRIFNGQAPPHTHPQPRLLSIMTSIAAIKDSWLIVVYYGLMAAT